MRYRITKLILNLNKRLMLGNVSYLEWTPNSNIMTILGRNGCGKSSLLDELTPCAAHHSNYLKGGYKEIHISSDTDHYVLKSVFKSGTGHHSFIKNGTTELNAGGTFVIQEELVWHEFKMDRDIHAILTGQQLFTAMSTSKRREIITMMSPVDLTFAFKILDIVNRSNRDTVGVIKHLERRLKDESDDIPNEAQIGQLKVKVNEHVGQLNKLLQLEETGLSPVFNSNNEPKELIDIWLNKAKRVLNYYPVINDPEIVYNTEEYRQRINYKESEYNALNNYISHLVEELEQLKDQNVTTLTIDPKEIQAIELEISELEKAIVAASEFIENRPSFFPLVNIGDIYNPDEKLSTVFERWYNLIINFPINPDGLFSKNKLTEYQQQLLSLEQKRTAVQDRLIITNRRVMELKECQKVDCPNCNHNFIPGIDPNEIIVLENNITKYEAYLVEADKRIHECKNYIEKCNEYIGYVQQFTQLIRDYPDFGSLWDHCLNEKVMYVNPNQYTNDVLIWYENMQTYLTIQTNKKQLDQKVSRLINLKAIDADAVEYVKQKIQTITQTIESKTGLLIDTKKDLDEYRRTGEGIQKFINVANELIDEYNQLIDQIAAHFKYLVNKGIGEEIKLNQFQLAEYQNQLTKFERQEAVLQSLQKERTDTLNEQTQLNLIAKALSVKDGLIGKYLLESLTSVLSLVNSVINTIWTYEMNVIPSKLDKEGLDYNFPLDVNDGSVTPPDIRLGSESQKDIVNFAFKLAFIKFMGYDGWPLYLDEFGRTFDEQHRDNTVPFIQNLIEQNEFEQIFYISHFESTYGSFNNVEYLVIDPTNITVPQCYNENVVIK